MVTSKGKTEEVVEETQIVTFELGEEMYGTNVEQVREINKLGNITKVPHMPDFISGVMNLRGQITTIINLRDKFKVDEDGFDEEKARIIVAEIEGNQLGVVVDSVKDVTRIPVENISAPPDTISNKIKTKFIEGLCDIDDELIVILDISKILSEEELEKIIETENVELDEEIKEE